MTTLERIAFLTECWGKETTEKVVNAAIRENSPMEFNDFLTHCSACGGNWGGMLLTGIKSLFPQTWAAIPDDMGVNAWSCLCDTLALLGVSAN